MWQVSRGAGEGDLAGTLNGTASPSHFRRREPLLLPVEEATGDIPQALIARSR